MKKILSRIFLLLLFSFVFFAAQSQQRFPKPEFESGYEQPTPTTPEPRSAGMEWADVFVLLAVLSMASWLAIKKRSRKGMIWLSLFTLIYFGFYREGCICSIGSIQNVALAFFDSGYKLSLTVLAFFLLPLIFALFFGRTFCAGACPLGAIQDLIVINPVSIPSWVRKTLDFFPYVYLGFAILFAATGTDFIICRYDPFVGIFRMNAPYIMILLGVAFLFLGMFFARPYCRVFCPYGVLLNWMSKFSKWHMTISPAECIKCKLCEPSCPFDAIEIPVNEKERTESSVRKNLKRFSFYLVLIPVWILAGGFALSKAHVFLSRANPTVYLAEILITHPELKTDTENLDIQTFLESGKSMQELVEEATLIRNKFRRGGWYLGGFLGLVLGIMIMNQFTMRKQEIYEPHKGNCFSCARCIDYCPVEKKK
ncbi:MAG: 4Fe-4S binding protein [Bacteroidales bacterium]|nr:4Fe-4S binding protein [Bacteroidales bacterium]MCF8390039.1 4Fe-4S binding protein [Bacteroidales bacterium]